MKQLTYPIYKGMENHCSPNIHESQVRENYTLNNTYTCISEHLCTKPIESCSQMGCGIAVESHSNNEDKL